MESTQREFAAYFKQLGYRQEEQCEPTCRQVWVMGNAVIGMTIEKNRLNIVKSVSP